MSAAGAGARVPRTRGGAGTWGGDTLRVPPLVRPKRGSFTALSRETPSPCCNRSDFFFLGGGDDVVTRCPERAGTSQPPATTRVGSWEGDTHPLVSCPTPRSAPSGQRGWAEKSNTPPTHPRPPSPSAAGPGALRPVAGSAGGRVGGGTHTHRFGFVSFQ